MSYPESLKEEVRQQVKSGKTMLAVANEMGLYHTTVREWCSDRVAAQRRARNSKPGVKEGRAAYCKAWRDANPEKVKEYNERKRDIRSGAAASWYTANKERKHAQSRKRAYDNPVRAWAIRVVSGARCRAHKKGLPFALTVDDVCELFPVDGKCPVLGIELNLMNGVGNRGTSPSLDRIVPELGYVKENVAVISMRANMIKSNASLDELQAVTNWLSARKVG